MASALRAQWNALVGRAWPVWGAAILVATVNVFLFAFDRPWTASDGLRNWGDWVLTGVGVLRRPDLLPPWLYSGSLLNLGVLLGGAAGALCAREFAVRVPAPGELIKGAAGGAVRVRGGGACAARSLSGIRRRLRRNLPALTVLSRARVPRAVHDRRRRAHARRGARAGGQHTGLRDSEIHRPQGQGRLGLRRRGDRRPARRHALRHRHDARGWLRRGLDLACGRGAGEALGGGRVLRAGRFGCAPRAGRRARESGRGRVSA